MKFTSSLRRNIFWIKDFLAGSTVRTDYVDIKHSLSLSSFKQLQKKNEPLLHNLLSMATESTEFYKSYGDFKSLQDFPVINKLIIREHFEEITIPQKRARDQFSVFTSGSTGTPFSIYQTKRKKIRNTADTLYFANSTGYTLGDKLFYIRKWTHFYRKNWLISKLQNIVPIDIDDLNDTYISNLIEKLKKDKSPKSWLGYPSSFKQICDYLEKTEAPQLDCNVKSIIGMSERFDTQVKFQMEYYFKCPAVSRYSNVENGILGQQMPGENYFMVNWASYVIEILNMKDDLPVAFGEFGRIVITDLYNTATPMIRYDTGDIGAFGVSGLNTNDFPFLKSVQGRLSDILIDTKGKMINPFKMHGYLYNFPELKQVQFIQKGKNIYHIKLNHAKSYSKEQELIDLFKHDVGNDAKITIEYVQSIPTLLSGKRKITENLYKPKS